MMMEQVVEMYETQISHDKRRKYILGKKKFGNKWMIQNGQGILSVKQKDTGEFYKLLVEYYESGKGDLLKQFLCESCIDGMNFS
jgi:hypothetical protein